jgi:hypothetical protein
MVPVEKVVAALRRRCNASGRSSNIDSPPPSTGDHRDARRGGTQQGPTMRVGCPGKSGLAPERHFPVEDLVVEVLESVDMVGEQVVLLLALSQGSSHLAAG